MDQSNGLVIGPGFEAWIAEHQATPESDELYWSTEMSACMVRVSQNGEDVRVLLMYNKMTNLIVPFAQAVL